MLLLHPSSVMSFTHFMINRTKSPSQIVNVPSHGSDLSFGYFERYASGFTNYSIVNLKRVFLNIDKYALRV